MASDWDVGFLDSMSRKVALQELTVVIDEMLLGKVSGRIVVDLREDI